MTWEEKFAAIKSLSEAHLEMRQPGDWYVAQHGVEIGGDGMLKGILTNGETPQDAVISHWNRMSTLGEDRYLVVNAYNKRTRQQFRWSGYMWQSVARVDA